MLIGTCWSEEDGYCRRITAAHSTCFYASMASYRSLMTTMDATAEKARASVRRFNRWVITTPAREVKCAGNARMRPDTTSTTPEDIGVVIHQPLPLAP